MTTQQEIEPNCVMMIDDIQEERGGYHFESEDELDVVHLVTDEQGQRWIITVGFGVPTKYEEIEHNFTEEQKAELESVGYIWD